MSSWTNSARIWGDAKSCLAESRKLIVYDTETTGLSPERDRIIEFAAIKFDVSEDYSLTQTDSLHLYINPGMPLPSIITEITGITEEELADKPHEEDVFDQIRSFMDESATICGYNIISFDNRFIDNLYARQGLRFKPSQVIDGIVLARDRLKKDYEVENHKLGTIAAYYGIDFQAHSALEDAGATARVVEQLFKEYAEEEKDMATVKAGLIRPGIKAVRFWEGYRGFSRIYVNTDAGDLFYDIRRNEWGAKPPCDIESIDMEWLEAEACRVTSSAPNALRYFKGNIEL